jgi:hypothetical protein
MSWRRIICLCLMFPVLALGVHHVPAGQGPFPATFGPATNFQAVQALFVLMSLMAAAVAARLAFGSGWTRVFSAFVALENFSPISAHQHSLDSSLRC